MELIHFQYLTIIVLVLSFLPLKDCHTWSTLLVVLYLFMMKLEVFFFFINNGWCLLEVSACQIYSVRILLSINCEIVSFGPLWKRTGWNVDLVLKTHHIPFVCLAIDLVWQVSNISIINLSVFYPYPNYKLLSLAFSYLQGYVWQVKCHQLREYYSIRIFCSIFYDYLESRIIHLGHK